MLTIYKYPIAVTDEQIIGVPSSGFQDSLADQFLSLKVQNGCPYLWVMVDPSNQVITRHISIRGTGHDCEGLLKKEYLGSFTFLEDSLVFHVFGH